MERLSRDEIYSLLSQRIERVPSLPTDFSSGYLSYFTHRVREVRDIWSSYGLTPEHLTVMGASGLLTLFSGITEIDGMSIDYVVNPMADYLSDDALDMGTYLLDFSSLNPISLSIPPAVGIAYPFEVSAEHYEVRWTLQVVDGMDFAQAERAAALL